MGGAVAFDGAASAATQAGAADPATHECGHCKRTVGRRSALAYAEADGSFHQHRDPRKQYAVACKRLHIKSADVLKLNNVRLKLLKEKIFKEKMLK